MEKMYITGTLKLKKNEQVVSEKFKKREFVITDNSSQYPQQLMFQLTQAKCSLLDEFNVGQEIKVHFNLRGREWTSPDGEIKYFNTLEAWRLEKGNGNTAESQERAVDESFPAAPPDDLPF